jgi:hypothetical protein
LPTGASLRLDKVTSWTAKQVTSDQKIKGLDGITDHLRFFDGWSGSFKLERRAADIDRYFAQAEANFYNGEDDPPAVLQQTIREPDGTVSQYRFERILLTYDDAGDWAGDKSVSQSVSFMASRRIQQA